MTISDPTAAVLLIGDELLSGRTRDVNLQQIAEFLGPLGIPVKETRIVSDDQDAIVAAVNALRTAYSYVFTTGGIGPTHDDITADAIAMAFGVEIHEHPDAVALLTERYAAMETEFTPARRRMTRVPKGASLIANPVSGAPGFQTGNVFTMAGVPSIVRGMLGDIAHRLETGTVVQVLTLRGNGLREGDIAEALGALAQDYPELSIGSYPWFRAINDSGVQIVMRGSDEAMLVEAEAKVAALIRSKGIEPVRMEDPAA